MHKKEIEKLAHECGFTTVGELSTETINLRREVRDTCKENRCGAYNKNWSCPPACGTLEECEKKLKKYTKGYILQTTGYLDGPFDAEGMQDASEKHESAVKKFNIEIKRICPHALLLGAGGCKICKECTYPDKECRFPELLISSMEAFGMLVSDVCKANGLPYYYGKNTLTYVACVLIDLA